MSASETDVRKWLVELADESSDTRKAAITSLSKSGEMRLDAFFKDFSEGSTQLWKGQVVICENTKGGAIIDALTREPLPGKPVATPEIAKEFKNMSPSGGGERNRVKNARSLLGLFAPDKTLRKDSITKCGMDGIESSLPTLRELKKTEPEKANLNALDVSISLLELISADGKKWTPEHIEALKRLGGLSPVRTLSRLKELQAANNGSDPAATKALNDAIAHIESWQSTANGIGHVFSGISAGTILILMALGLSIIFGLMGVINMAHGELMMIGAYATYVTQKGFEAYLPASAFNWFFVTAIPFAFLSAAIVGYLMERLVIRHLYGRPLDSMLATWGISLFLTQAVRLRFGDNIGVNSPSWLIGSIEIVPDVNLPYNRLFIILFCGLCIALMYFIIDKTKLGLLLRATTQNRNMSASLGVNTRRIDGFTFALGAGLAGMAGCALTQVGGVTPDMGSNYIVDSFLTVVTGGVGKLAGAIWAGMGIGVFNKFLEAFFAAVWGKVLILACVVLFMQWRPSGLFPAKGRTADV